ncbi:MAG: PQQ-binding-like beta-propeller repeat protein, partial [Rhodospirillaceae bacterium]
MYSKGLIRIALTSMICASAMVVAACSQEGGDWTEPAAQDWPLVGGDWGNSRFSTLDQINTANVGQLGGAWVRELPGGGPLGTPIVLNGRMFVTTARIAHALDPRSGEILWSYELPVPAQGLYKGMAAGDNMVFVGLSNSRIVALDQETGEEIWIGVIGDPDFDREGQFISGAPVYADGMVIAGLANGDYGIRGRVVALDADTGEQAWRFYTVPYEGEAGHETWPQDHDDWKPGGSGVWMNGAVDPELGIVYFGVGNPIPQWGGEARAGDNLYSESVIALDVRTGELRWHYQVVHHDIWEADLGT